MLTEEMAGCVKTIENPRIPRGVMLCGACKRAISRIESSFPGFHDGPRAQCFVYASRQDTWRGAHHIQDGAFALAVAERCYVCHTLHEACPKKARKYINFVRTFYEIEPQNDDRYLLRFAIEVFHTSLAISVPQLIETYGTFKLLPSKLFPHVGGPLGLTKDTFSPQCRAQIKEWLDDCVDNHRVCIEDWRTRREFPARLLNVNPGLGSQVRLEVNMGKEHRPRYVTMSHCWNHDPGVHLTKLTAANEERLRSGFEICTLPQKFQHGIKVAQWMGINYLWIDALCILQGSADDWNNQSSIMGDIYAGSHCNIAATSADEMEGCFRERNVEVVEPYLINDPKTLSETYAIGYDDFWCNSLLDTNLHTRGWALQERLLSPRTIHFGKEQMFWECRKHKACEAYPKGIPEEFSNRRTEAWRLGEQMLNPKKKTFASQSLLARTISWLWSWSSTFISSKQAYKFWGTAVEWYMNCDLTESSDKLVAVAGIANKIKETTGERYLAGLWENADLAQSLLWFVPTRRQADGRPSLRHPSLGSAGYRAPSWSWASIDAKIVWNWPAECDQVLLNIDHTNITVPGDAMSTVTSAEMHIKGQLVAVHLSTMHKCGDGSPKEDGSYTLRPKDTAVASPTTQTYTAEGSCVEPLVYLDTPLSPQSTVEAYLMPVCRRCRDRNGNVIAEISGLILKRSAPTETKYERIGVFGLHSSQAHIVEAKHSRASSRSKNTEQFTLL